MNPTKSREQRLMLAALISGATTLITFTFVVVTLTKIVPPPGCTPAMIDFHPIWAAGRLGLSGQPLAAFDQQTLIATYNGCRTTVWFPWLHPAPMMTIMAVFAVFPILPAIFLFGAFSILAFGFALRAFLSPKTPAFWAILLAPAILPALISGQVVVLWMACLLGMIAGLRNDRPILTAVCVALMTLKPTLGLMIPVVLLATSRYRVIGLAIVATIAIHGGATLIHGVDYWPLWFETTKMHITQSIAVLGLKDYHASLAGFLAAFGMPGQTAAFTNLAVTGLLAIIIFVVWRKLGPKSDISAATLSVAIPLSSSYLWLYDTAFLCLTALFLYRAVENKSSPWLWLLLGALWVGPGAMIWNYVTYDVYWFSPVSVLPPLMLIALFVCLGTAYKQANAQPA